jgi:Zn-finger nucleic acid-binding protein
MKTCPRHQADLTTRQLNEHEIHDCPECEGIWAPGPVIDTLLGSGQNLQLRSLCSVLESDLHCPSGCGKLFQGKVGRVTVDLCQNCGGLWLDPGELEILRQRKGISPHVPVSQTRPGSTEANNLLLGLTLIPW